MATTLEQAKLNALEDYDPAVIDEFRKSSALLDALIFDQAVNPAGGGATLTYGYRRLVTQPTAEFREYNTEYTPQSVTTEKHSVDLVPLGGAFEVDRVLANVGPAASNEVTLQMSQKIKAATAFFTEQVIVGDTAVNEHGFDGLDKALTGSTTEIGADGSYDWSAFTSADEGMAVLDHIDELLGALDGEPTIIFGNKAALAKVRAAARRANMFTKSPVEGLLDARNNPIVRDTYDTITLVDTGAKAGTNDPVIPVGEDGTTSLYAVRIGLDGFHAVSTTDEQLVKTWLPDFSTAGAVKKGEVELGPVAPVLKTTKAAAVLRNIKVRPGAGA